MPSKEDICVVPETLPSKKEFSAADVEELVAAIKHNLQLKARPLRFQRCPSKQRRMSPYSVPLRTICKHASGDKENTAEHSSYTCKYCILKSKSPTTKNNSDDPYEMLQELIREGSLIKEAVKRLQFDVDNKRSKKTDFYHLELDDMELIDVENI